MDAHRTRLLATLAGVALLSAGILGCTPAADDAGPDESVPPSDAPALSLPDVPAVAEDEIARAVFQVDGPDGVPETALTTNGVVVADTSIGVEGACVGGQTVAFDVLSAAVDDSGDTLASGTIVCDGTVQNAGPWSTAFSGPAQFVVTSADDVELAWLIARSVAG